MSKLILNVIRSKRKCGLIAVVYRDPSRKRWLLAFRPRRTIAGTGGRTALQPEPNPRYGRSCGIVRNIPNLVLRKIPSAIRHVAADIQGTARVPGGAVAAGKHRLHAGAHCAGNRIRRSVLLFPPFQDSLRHVSFGIPKTPL